jgi:integrase
VSPSAFITKRQTNSGPRFVVRFRVGGRYSKLIHAGSFKRQADARTRRDFVISELAAGRDPRATLALLEHTQPQKTLGDWTGPYLNSLVDLADSTRELYELFVRTRIRPALEDRVPAEITPADVQAAINDWSVKLAPNTVGRIVAVLRLLLDYAGVEPNPARHRTVRLPRVRSEEIQVPSRDEVAVIVAAVPAKYRLPIRLLEATAMRVGELTSLTWGDVDARNSRLRVSRMRAKTGRARFALVPLPLMRQLDNLVPREDRTPGRQVFPGMTDNAIRQAMRKACRDAGIPHYHPHDLRHRRASLWLAQGRTARELEELGGWTKASTPLNIYAHLIAPDDDEWGPT